MFTLEKGTFCVVPIKSLYGLNPYLQVIYMWLCHHANQDGVCWPSLSTLSKETGMSERVLIKYIKELEDKKLLNKTSRKDEDGDFKSNLYKVLVYESNQVVTESNHGGYSESPWVVTDGHSNYNHRTKLKEPKPISCAPKVAPDIDTDYEMFKSVYPNRSGSLGWSNTKNFWNARLKEGIRPEIMINGANRYAIFCRETGKTNTEYVMQPQRFLGKDKHFLNKWEINNAATNYTSNKPKSTAAKISEELRRTYEEAKSRGLVP